MGRTRKSLIVHRPGEGTTAAKDATIKEIALIMAAGQWHPYRSTIEYAAKEGLSEYTIAEYAKMAARLLRLAWTDEGAKSAVLEKIQALGDAAAARTEEVLDKEGKIVTVRRPDYKSAITAAQSIASILGMTKQEHTLKVTYERMTDEQLMAEAVKFLDQQQKPKALPAAKETTHDREDGTESEMEDAEFESDDS